MMSRPPFRSRGMASARVALLLVLVALTPLLAGCNLRDWTRLEGRVNVQLVPIGAQNTSLSDFRALKVAIYGVSVKQVLILDPKEFKFQDASGNAQPLVVDLVDKGLKGQRVPLVQGINMSIRAIESITLHIDVIEATGADGKPVPICREGDQSVVFPCVFVPKNQAFRHQDRNIPIPRGGTVTLGFPIAVQLFGNPGAQEYALFEDPSLFEITNS